MIRSLKELLSAVLETVGRRDRPLPDFPELRCCERPTIVFEANGGWSLLRCIACGWRSA